MYLSTFKDNKTTGHRRGDAWVVVAAIIGTIVLAIFI